MTSWGGGHQFGGSGVLWSQWEEGGPIKFVHHECLESVTWGGASSSWIGGASESMDRGGHIPFMDHRCLEIND